ncbi:MAG: hypothetical protein ACYC9O_06415 [Candidatus Latescibacterota bacterium]
MNKIALSFVTSIIVAGCVFSEGEDKDKSGEGGIAGEYLPKKPVGASFTWKSTETDLEEGSSMVTTSTISISNTETIDGKTYYASYTDSGKLYNHFYIEDEGLYFRIDGTMYRFHKEEFPYGKPMENDFCFFSFDTSQGVERTVMDWGSTTDSTYVNYIIKEMYLGAASTTVPAGQFTDCRQYQIKPSLTFTPKITGDIIRHSRGETHWFAKGIGPVRREIDVMYNGKVYKRITEELVSYSLP